MVRKRCIDRSRVGCAARKSQCIVVNNLLCLRCPRCEQRRLLRLVFARLDDCGVDAHRHVNNCAHNTTQPRNVYGTVAQFEQAQRDRRANLLREYLRDRVSNDDVRDAVRAAIGRELVDLKIEI